MTEPTEEDEDYEQRKERYEDRPHLRIVLDMLKLNIGMIWTNNSLHDIKEILDANSREAPARVGSIAPKDVVIPAGPTGLDPKQTGFFQALSIQTKIVKAQIEIVNPVTIIHEGEKINQSQAALLDKLKIRPFEYKMHVKSYMEDGKLISAKVLSISNDDILAAFKKGGNNMTALSLGSGYVVSSAAPHLLMNAFKNLACVGIAADYEFEQLGAIKAAAAAGPAPSSGGGGAAAASAPAEAKKEEPKEESEEMDLGGGLFGDDDEY